MKQAEEDKFFGAQKAERIRAHQGDWQNQKRKPVAGYS